MESSLNSASLGIRPTLPAQFANSRAPEALGPLRTPQRTLIYLARQLLRPAIFKDTGLEGLSTRDFLALARSRRAFYHATETELRSGWWSALLSSSFLESDQSRPFREYLDKHTRGRAVVEIGPGNRIKQHQKLLRQEFGATHYLSVDLNSDSERFGAAISDALTYFSWFQPASIDTILAFGVFNEPMSLQFPADDPPRLFLPARTPEEAARAHCEHEYVRRLAREMLRVLKPGGVLLGDGMFSRGFETEVASYLQMAGFTEDASGFTSLQDAQPQKFYIRDPFFLKRPI
jgi:hypothetical protein